MKKPKYYIIQILLISLIFNIQYIHCSSEDEEEDNEAHNKGLYTVQLLNQRQNPVYKEVIEGQLSALYYSQNKAVCGQKFDKEDAQVACVEMGYKMYSFFERGTRCQRDNQEMFFGKIQCEGDEQKLSDCPQPHYSDIEGDSDCQGLNRCVYLGCASEGWIPPANYDYPNHFDKNSTQIPKEESIETKSVKNDLNTGMLVTIIMLLCFMVGMLIGFGVHRKDLVRTIEELKKAHQDQLKQIKEYKRSSISQNNIMVSGPQNLNNSDEDRGGPQTGILTEQTKRRISNQPTQFGDISNNNIQYNESQKLVPLSMERQSKRNNNKVVPGYSPQMGPVMPPATMPQMPFMPPPMTVPNIQMQPPMYPASPQMMPQPLSDQQIEFMRRKEEYKQYQMEQINNVFKTHDPVDPSQVKPNTFFLAPDNEQNIKQVQSQIVKEEEEQDQGQKSKCLKKVESQIFDLTEQTQQQQLQQLQQQQQQNFINQQQTIFMQQNNNTMNNQQYQSILQQSELQQQQFMFSQQQLLMQQQQQQQLQSKFNIGNQFSGSKQQQQSQFVLDIDSRTYKQYQDQPDQGSILITQKNNQNQEYKHQQSDEQRQQQNALDNNSEHSNNSNQLNASSQKEENPAPLPEKIQEENKRNKKQKQGTIVPMQQDDSENPYDSVPKVEYSTQNTLKIENF